MSTPIMTVAPPRVKYKLAYAKDSQQVFLVCKTHTNNKPLHNIEFFTRQLHKLTDPQDTETCLAAYLDENTARLASAVNATLEAPVLMPMSVGSAMECSARLRLPLCVTLSDEADDKEVVYYWRPYEFINL